MLRGGGLVFFFAWSAKKHVFRLRSTGQRPCCVLNRPCSDWILLGVLAIACSTWNIRFWTRTQWRSGWCADCSRFEGSSASSVASTNRSKSTTRLATIEPASLFSDQSAVGRSLSEPPQNPHQNLTRTAQNRPGTSSEPCRNPSRSAPKLPQNSSNAAPQHSSRTAQKQPRTAPEPPIERGHACHLLRLLRAPMTLVSWMLRPCDGKSSIACQYCEIKVIWCWLLWLRFPSIIFGPLLSPWCNS